MTDDQIKAIIQGHEGYRDHVYLDSLGNPTCGWGHNLAKDSKVPEKAAQAFFNQDFREASANYLALMRKYNLNLDEIRRAVLIDMLFNMGYSKVCGFTKMLAALMNNDYVTAAEEMLDSRWAGQVGDRALDLAEMMNDGDLK